ncbi:DUF6504 family protein [Pseudoblastomonas halimionae]|uniref:DNA-directed DNA polymerase n=1 Tax=Alteriqipengyuania halimionae TaxID=1926630 RepID=A0A6I4TYE9_9SPHN|nr:DUF6504 family protein [Alteriqipengyuania halimionae]MXP08829.1 DNA polymerase Y family protein [Alteriqipengyuania halimionae]
MSRVIVSLWFPNLAIDRWSRNAARRGDGDAALEPVVLVTETAHGPVIDAASPLAAEAGAQAGMRLADARMLAPGLVALPSDHEGNARTLERIALAAQRWGPWSMVDGADGALLNASGAAHLFDGEVALLAAIERRFAMQGYTCRPAIAPTAGAAWALSHYGGERPLVLDPAALPRALAPLPVAALRLNEDTKLLLARLGLKTIGDLMDVPRENLVRRFRNRRAAEANPLARLDHVLGRTAEPLVPLVEETPLSAERHLMEPLLALDLLARIVTDLAEDLARSLEAERKGARRLHLLLWRVDGDTIARTVELASPSRDPEHLARLFDDRLEGIDAPFGIDQARLIAVWAERLEQEQDRLDAPEANGTSFPVLIDRLVTRLGRQRVARLAPRGSHLPERSQRRLAPDVQPPAGQYDLDFHQRPLKLLDRAEPITVIYATPEGLPRRFRWRGGLHDIARVEGPERLAPEWWRERSSARLRDYYRIEDETGRRYWIYRHGLVGDGRGGPPDWYLHGFFA